MSTTLRVKIDATGPEVEIDGDVDVYAHLPVGMLDEPDAREQSVQVKFTNEGIIIDVFEEGMLVGTSSETYDEIHDRLRNA